MLDVPFDRCFDGPTVLPRGASFDRYTIEALIGEGGMGTVYRAYDDRLQRPVALKLLRREVGAPAHDAAGNARLLREARAAGALSHANAVAIYDVGEVDGTAFISMELVDGRSLRSYVGTGELGIPARVAILADVARALGAAHERGLVHRDVKPENVMLRADGAVKVLDFGLARRLLDASPASIRLGSSRGSALASMSHEGGLAGTPRYMAPEQMRGEPVDARTDQFSWGVVAYELLTGRPPWAGETATLSLVAAIQMDDPPSPRDLDEAIPEGVSQAVMRALSKVPGERFASMTDVAQALGPGPRSQGRRRRPWVVAGVGAALVLAALGAGAVAVRASGRRAPPAVAVAETAPAPTSIVDLPVPATGLPEARAAYVAGVHALREGSVLSAIASLSRATELDPSLAAGHLRLVLWGRYAAGSSPHEHFARASQQQALLSERDRAVLWMVEPEYLTDPPDEPKATERAREVAQRWPLDAELQLWMATRASDTPTEVALYERALTIDPQYGLALMRLSNVQLLEGDYPRALEALDRCLTIAPSSSGCLAGRISLYEEVGRCADMERDARLLASTSPSMRSGDWVARALYAGGGSLQTVHGALELKWAAASAESRAATQRRDEAHLAILRGDFVEAEKLERALAADVAGAATEEAHAEVLAPLVELLLERGDTPAATRLADQYLGQRAAWQTAGPWAPVPEMLAVATRGGARTEVERDAALSGWRAQWDGFEGPLHRQAWVLGRAIPASTEAEALTALREAPSPLPRVHSNQFHREGLEAAGRVLLLAGRAAEAVPLLRAAAGSCEALEVPLEHTQAHGHLGQALEATGDVPGACAAYGVVIDRWGRAGRSVTAARAKARRSALRCP